MDKLRLLQVGDRFTCPLFAEATMTSNWADGRLHAVPDRLTMGGSRSVDPAACIMVVP